MLRVGQITSPHGVRGAVKVYPLTDQPSRFAAGARLWLAGTLRQVEWTRESRPLMVVKLAGVEDRPAAEALRGEYLEIPEAEAASPAAGWYHHQLEGLAVRTEAGHRLGRLTSVLPRPANDVWVVDGPRGEVLVPATRDAVRAVDLEAGEVVVADWLLEVEEA